MICPRIARRSVSVFRGLCHDEGTLKVPGPILSNSKVTGVFATITGGIIFSVEGGGLAIDTRGGKITGFGMPLKMDGRALGGVTTEAEGPRVPLLLRDCFIVFMSLLVGTTTGREYEGISLF